MKKLLLMAAALSAVVTGYSDVKTWTGGGDNDNMSNPANWADGVAPASGDTLVFMGNVRTSPVNDFDPESYIFAGIVFSNTTAVCDAPFTLSGNRLRIKQKAWWVKDIAGNNVAIIAGIDRDFLIWPMNSSGAIEDTIACDVDIVGGGQLGCLNGKGHGLLFRGTLDMGGTSIYLLDQIAASMTFEGPVKNVNSVQRNNGGCTVHLKSAQNEFTSTASHRFNEGKLKVDSVAAYGGSQKGISLGQSGYETPATLIMNANEDTRIDGPIQVNGPKPGTVGGYIQNNIAGTTLSLGGALSAMSKNDLGTAVCFTGVGDGIFDGQMVSLNTWVRKAGTGTWTLAGGEASCVSTGSVTVAEGQLVIDGDYSTFQNVSVSKGAILTGTGHVAKVTLNSGAKYLVKMNEDGFQPLEIDGDLVVNGSAQLILDQALRLPGNREYTLLKCGSLVQNGLLTLGDGFPDTAIMQVKDNGDVTLMISSEQLTWKGDDANNVWDFTSPNWSGDKAYVDGSGVSFDDTASSEAEEVQIASEVSPLGVRVSGSHNYTFTGAAIAGVGGISKLSGDSVLTIANTNTYTGATAIDSGALVVSGKLKGTEIVVNDPAVFTNTVTGCISGEKKVYLYGPAFELDGTNDFSGGLVIDAVYGESLSKINHVVKNPAALGTGPVTLEVGSVIFNGVAGSAGRGQTLTAGAKGAALLYTQTPFTWLGNVEITGQTHLQLRPIKALTFGEPGCDTVIHSSGNFGVNVRNSGPVHYYSRLDLGGAYTQTDGNVAHFYAPGNKWTSLTVQVGGIVCHATNTLAVAAVDMGQVWEDGAFKPYLDLNGFDQTISGLRMNKSIGNSSQTVKSDLPAVLTITNDADTVTARYTGRITGAVTLRKTGLGNWSFACPNLSTGDVIVEGGTFTVTEDDALPSTADTSRLVILPEGRVALAEGVNATVSRLSKGSEIDLPAGIYGGEGCTVSGAKIRSDLFAPGAGALTVRHGSGGTTIIIR